MLLSVRTRPQLSAVKWYLSTWVQSKRHRLWFSTKTCSCYSTKTYVDSLILSPNWIWLRWETNTIKCVWCSTKTTFNVYVSQRSQIQFEDKDHAVYMSFRLETTTCLRWEPQPVTLWLYPVLSVPRCLSGKTFGSG